MTSNNTYGQWLLDWTEIYKKPLIKPSSFKTIDICLRLHIPDWLKDMTISDIKPYNLQKSLNMVNSSRMRLFVYDIYADSFKRALQHEIITKNPMTSIDKVKHIRKQGKALNRAEIQELLSKLNNSRFRSLVLFYLYTGVRRSEALNLRWTDIDYDKGIMTINGTKTLKACRTVPIFKDLLPILQNIPQENDYLFNYAPEYVSKRFHKICPAHKLHDLRHTFATRCLECGIAIKVVQLWLGHTRLDTTASIYTHVLDDFNRIEAQKYSLF